MTTVVAHAFQDLSEQSGRNLDRQSQLSRITATMSQRPKRKTPIDERRRKTPMMKTKTTTMKSIAPPPLMLSQPTKVSIRYFLGHYDSSFCLLLLLTVGTCLSSSLFLLYVGIKTQ
jgi:hypothetical protein